MNRQLLGLLALLALLAGGALLVMNQTPAPVAPDSPASVAVPAALPQTVPEPAEEQARVTNPEPGVRAPAAEKPAAKPASEARDGPPMRKGQPAALVGVVVRFAGSGEPVRNALASLTYDLKGQKTQNERMQPLKEGRFELVVPLGAQLRALDVCGSALMLEGPRLPSNAGSRFQTLHASLDAAIDAKGAELRFEVQHAQDVIGIVVDAQSRAPLADAEVDVWLPVGRRARMSTGADGKFQLTAVGGRPTLRVSCDGYLESEVRVLPEDAVRPEPGLVVPLARGLRVCGSVFDAHGAPVRFATLELHTHGNEANGQVLPAEDQRRAVSDEQGNFCFVNVPRCAGASIFEPNDGRLVIPTRMQAVRELGPIGADVEGLFLMCRDGTWIDLRIVRGDGTSVAPGKYFCTCEEAGLLDDVPVAKPEDAQQRFVALGVPVRLVVYAREREDDPDHLLVGRRTLNLEKREQKPLEVRIVVDEPLDATPPTTSAPLVELDYPSVVATLDLRLLDSAGKPFPAGTKLDFELGGASFGDLALLESELRLRCPPSREAYRARVRIGGQSRSFDLVVPPGYSRAEQRIWIVP